MGYFEASIFFVTGLIAFAILVSVGAELIPSISESMGNTTALMVSLMFVVILAVGFLIYVRQSQQPDQYMDTSFGGRNYQ